ncbi:MAG: hypothetical protein M1838_000017 [Thelocarpon superellum]|nr:MAG: hypothetical protein M1838_000017 [Thelocarpon superellum]
MSWLTPFSTDEKDQRLLLCIQYGCNEKGVKLPWDNITRVLDPQISEGAIIQHLSKIRQRLESHGVPVPPPLRRGGLAVPDATRAAMANPPSLRSAPRRDRSKAVLGVAGSSPTSKVVAVDAENDAEYSPTTKKGRAALGRQSNGKAAKREFSSDEENEKIKREVEVDDQTPTSQGKYKSRGKAGGVKRRRTGKHSDNAAKDGTQGGDESISHVTEEDKAVGASSSRGRNAGYMKFFESDSEHSDGERSGSGQSDLSTEVTNGSPSGIVVMKLPKGYTSAEFPRGLAHWPAGAFEGDIAVSDGGYNSPGPNDPVDPTDDEMPIGERMAHADAENIPPVGQVMTHPSMSQAMAPPSRAMQSTFAPVSNVSTLPQPALASNPSTYLQGPQPVNPSAFLPASLGSTTSMYPQAPASINPAMILQHPLGSSSSTYPQVPPAPLIPTYMQHAPPGPNQSTYLQVPSGLSTSTHPPGALAPSPSTHAQVSMVPSLSIYSPAALDPNAPQYPCSALDFTGFDNALGEYHDNILSNAELDTFAAGTSFASQPATGTTTPGHPNVSLVQTPTSHATRTTFMTHTTLEDVEAATRALQRVMEGLPPDQPHAEQSTVNPGTMTTTPVIMVNGMPSFTDPTLPMPIAGDDGIASGEDQLAVGLTTDVASGVDQSAAMLTADAAAQEYSAFEDLVDLSGYDDDVGDQSMPDDPWYEESEPNPTAPST